MIDADKLDFWFEHNRNVLLVGRHGVGKTAMLKSCFERHGLVMGESYLYFSAATLDPWVDLVGVPKEFTESKTAQDFELVKELALINKGLALRWVEANWKLRPDDCDIIINYVLTKKQGTTYLDLVRPRALAQDQVVAMFFDELNRSGAKTRNAVMECLQFKSINGKRFPHLRMIWAAINPEEGEEYNVEKLDPAQKSRFHVVKDIPYQPDLDWFIETFDERSARAACEWWHDLPEELKLQVPPRTLEYALIEWRDGGELEDILPTSVNHSDLKLRLGSGPIMDKMEKLAQDLQYATAGAAQKAAEFLQDHNNYATVLRHILADNKLIKLFFPHMPKERLSQLLVNKTRKSVALKYICNNIVTIPVFKEVVDEVVKAGQNFTLVSKITSILEKQVAEQQQAAKSTQELNQGPHKSNRQKVYACLSITDGKTVQQLCREAGVSINGIKPYLDQLVTNGTAKCHDGRYYYVRPPVALDDGMKRRLTWAEQHIKIDELRGTDTVRYGSDILDGLDGGKIDGDTKR